MYVSTWRKISQYPGWLTKYTVAGRRGEESPVIPLSSPLIDFGYPPPAPRRHGYRSLVPLLPPPLSFAASPPFYTSSTHFVCFTNFECHRSYPVGDKSESAIFKMHWYSLFTNEVDNFEITWLSLTFNVGVELMLLDVLRGIGSLNIVCLLGMRKKESWFITCASLQKSISSPIYRSSKGLC